MHRRCVRHGVTTCLLVAVALELALSLLPLRAAELRVAVASNFAMTLRDVAAPFEERSGHDVVLIAGSTGKLYAQIVHGAPFDVFFAADAARPRQLEKDSRIVAGSRFVYARGTLVLWSADSTLIDGTPDVLRTDFDRLAIANPDLAPYGRAGLEVLDALGLRDRVAARLVQGENVAQTFQFVSTGNAALGFVAASQVFRLAGDDTGSMWVVPDSLHAAIEQQAVLLRDSDVGRAFLTYCRSTEALRILRRAGYDAP